MKDGIPLPAQAEWSCREVRWDGDLSHELVIIWRQLLATMPHATIFHSPEWSAIACQTGFVRPWRVLLLSHRDHPIGVVPLYRRTIGSAEVVAPMALHHPAVILDVTREAEGYAMLAAWLQQRVDVRMLWLGRARVDGAARWRAVLQEGCVHAETMPSTMIVPLPARYEEFVAGLGSNTRKAIRSMERQFLGEAAGGSFEVVTSSDRCALLLEEMMAVHRRRWRLDPNGSAFESAACARFYQQAVCWAVENGIGEMYALRCHDRLMAAQTIFRLPGSDTVYAHIVARDSSVVDRRCPTPGLLLDAMIIRRAIEESARFYDMGYGSLERKAQLGGREYPLQEYALTRSPLEARVMRQFRWQALRLQRLPALLRWHWRRRVDAAR